MTCPTRPLCRHIMIALLTFSLASCSDMVLPSSPDRLQRSGDAEIIGSMTGLVAGEQWGVSHNGIYGVDGQYGLERRVKLKPGSHRLLLVGSHQAGVKSIVPITFSVTAGRSYRIKSYWHQDGLVRYWIEDSATQQKLWSAKVPVFSCPEYRTEECFRQAAEALGYTPKPDYGKMRLF